MRYANDYILQNAPVYTAQTSEVIDAGYICAISVQAVVTDSASAGSIKLQYSNDFSNPTNWSDIAGSSATIAGAGVLSIPKIDVSYRWLQCVTTTTVAGVQTITTVADVAGSLNSKYFFINAGASGIAYYVWMDNGAGVDPAIAGKTGVQVTYTNGDTANTIADLVAAALDALAGFVAPNPAANVISVTNAAAGSFVLAVDSVAAPTGFSFALVTPSGVISAKFKSVGF